MWKDWDFTNSWMCGFAPVQKPSLEAFEKKPHMTEKISVNS